MEEHGHEAKRPRLDTAYGPGSHRSQQHSIAPSHSYSPHALPPRNSYPSGAPPPSSSSYYEGGAYEHDRALPHPSSAHPGYTPHSGHSTPVREQRHYAPDPSYSRRGSASATTRSPDGSYQQYPSGRPLNGADGNYHSYASDSANHAVGYPNTDGTMNGHTHGLPMPTYPESSPAPTGRPTDYGQSPVNVAPPGYPSSAYGTPTSYQNLQTIQRLRKGNRATQVWSGQSSYLSSSTNLTERLATFAVKEKRSAMKGDRSVVTAWRMAYNAIIRLWHLQSNSSILRRHSPNTDRRVEPTVRIRRLWTT